MQIDGIAVKNADGTYTWQGQLTQDAKVIYPSMEPQTYRHSGGSFSFKSGEYIGTTKLTEDSTLTLAVPEKGTEYAWGTVKTGVVKTNVGVYLKSGIGTQGNPYVFAACQEYNNNQNIADLHPGDVIGKLGSVEFDSTNSVSVKIYPSNQTTVKTLSMTTLTCNGNGFTTNADAETYVKALDSTTYNTYVYEGVLYYNATPYKTFKPCTVAHEYTLTVTDVSADSKATYKSGTESVEIKTTGTGTSAVRAAPSRTPHPSSSPPPDRWYSRTAVLRSSRPPITP